MDYAIFFINDGKAIQQLNAVSITSFLKVVGIESLGTHGYENVWDYEKVIRQQCKNLSLSTESRGW